MIEVTKHGNTTLLCKCPECGCEFRFSPRDILFYYSENERMAVYNYIDCPECGEDIFETLDGHALADEWEKYMERRRKRLNGN